MYVKIFAMTMNTILNNSRNPYRVSHETNNEVKEANASCCFVNCMAFFLMVTGLYCLFSYDIYKNFNSNKSNLSDILNMNNKSNNFSVSIVS